MAVTANFDAIVTKSAIKQLLNKKVKYISLRDPHGKIQYIVKRGSVVKISDFKVENGKHQF